jgi:hypothetical protein
VLEIGTSATFQLEQAQRLPSRQPRLPPFVVELSNHVDNREPLDAISDVVRREAAACYGVLSVTWIVDEKYGFLNSGAVIFRSSMKT